jgi:hypothetical protein
MLPSLDKVILTSLIPNLAELLRSGFGTLPKTKSTAETEGGG